MVWDTIARPLLHSAQRARWSCSPPGRLSNTEAVDAPVHEDPVAALGVVALRLVRVPDVTRLSGREVAALPAGDPPEGSPGICPVWGHLITVA